MSSIALTLLLLVNSHRVHPLVLDADLSARAQLRAEYLCESRTFAHDNWTTWFYGRFAPTDKAYYGENLAQGASSVQNTDFALMHSKEHRKNIKDRRFKALGVGHACDITVELFANNIKN